MTVAMTIDIALADPFAIVIVIDQKTDQYVAPFLAMALDMAIALYMARTMVMVRASSNL